MALKKGKGKNIIARNYKAETKAAKPKNMAATIAYSKPKKQKAEY